MSLQHPDHRLTRSQIDELEGILRRTLPPSYRLFPSLHNGWKSWSGDVALLSTEQILRGEYANRIAKWRTDERTLQPTLIDNCLVIGFSLFVGEQILMDFSIPGKYGSNLGTPGNARFSDFLIISSSSKAYFNRNWPAISRSN